MRKEWKRKWKSRKIENIKNEKKTYKIKKHKKLNQNCFFIKNNNNNNN